MTKIKQPELDIDEVEAIIDWQDRMSIQSGFLAVNAKTKHAKFKFEKTYKKRKEKLHAWIEYRDTKWPK